MMMRNIAGQMIFLTSLFMQYHFVFMYFLACDVFLSDVLLGVSFFVRLHLDDP